MSDKSRLLQPLNLYERIALKIKHIRAMGMEPVALAYGRKSFVRTGQQFISTEYHEEICRQFCESLHVKMEWYADDKEGWQSGRAEKNRPEWARLKAQIGRPEVIMVICENTRAVFRNVKLILTYIDEWTQKGNDIEFIDISLPTLDVRTADGRAMLTVKAAFDESESRRTSDRAKKHVQAIRAKGGFWGKPPQGLTTEGTGSSRRLVASADGYWLATLPSGKYPVIGDPAIPPFMDSATAEWRTYYQMVETWLRMYNESKLRGRDAARQLNLEGWYVRANDRLPRRIRFYDLRRMLNQLESYKGILPDHLYERVHAIREQARKYLPRRRNQPRQLLSRLLYCSKCNRHFITTLRYDGVFCYDHRASALDDCPDAFQVSCHTIENLFWEELAPRLALTPQQKENITAEMKQHREAPPPADERQLLEEQLKRIGRLYRDMVIDEAEYDRDSEPLLRQLQALASKKREPAPRTVPLPEAFQRLDDIAETLYATWEIDTEAANAVLCDVFERIYIQPTTRPYHPKHAKHGRPHVKTKRVSPRHEWRILGVKPHAWAQPMFVDIEVSDIIANQPIPRFQSSPSNGKR
jgi:DNA invertase Pin-like site-specific DNA recombinase